MIDVLRNRTYPNLFGAQVMHCSAPGWPPRLWPAANPDDLPHRHDELSGDAHLADATTRDSATGAHTRRFVIDDEHRKWPN